MILRNCPDSDTNKALNYRVILLISFTVFHTWI